jgi:hypothetical protein
VIFVLEIFSYGTTYDDAFNASNAGDYKKAFKLYSQSCDDGNGAGCGMVGYFYEYGVAVKKDFQLASEFYSRSCNMGNEVGCEWNTKLKDKMPVCSQNDLNFANDKRYFDVTSSDIYPIILADANTIQIDKKNKTIKVWTIWIASQKGRDFMIPFLGNKSSNYGYNKDLSTYNYSNMTWKTNSFSHYTCDGSVLGSSSIDKWQDISPGSTAEGILESIIKKYNLK